MTLEHKNGERVAVALFPVDYATVEVVTDQGEEILQQLSRFALPGAFYKPSYRGGDFSEAQLFLHSIQELERVRAESKKSKKRKIGGAIDAVSEEKRPKTSGDEPIEDVVMKDEGGGGEGGDADADAVKTDIAGNGHLKENGTSGDDDAATDITSVDEALTVNDDEPSAVATGDDEDAEEEAEEEVIDPRIHYRPMVAELQASVIELNQLINTIDLIRRREYLEDMQCIRENTVEKKDELEYLIEAKAEQLKESSHILLAGVDALTSTVEKESNFFDGVSEMIRKWKICAPIHGNIPKPFRAGEPLAVDCSFVSAGSTYVPPTRSVADLAFAELSRTEKGLVCIKVPEEYMARTIQVELKSLVSGISGFHRLPAPKMSSMTRAALDKLENTPDDIKILDKRNASVLKAVQFSVFCEELFYTVMQEALWNSSNWNDSALSVKKHVAKKSQRNEDGGTQGPGNISVVEILDDEIRLRLRDQYEMTLRLLDARTSEDAKPSPKHHSTVAIGQQELNEVSRPHKVHTEQDFLRQTCRFALVLLQQEIRERHGRKEISRGLLFTSNDGSLTAGVSLGVQQSTSEADKFEYSGVLASVLNTISHNLLQEELARYLDEVSARLAFQNFHSSSTGRILEDGLTQPICDSVRGIYVSSRWKSCPFDSTLAAFDLSIGKNFSTEVLISGTKIRFEDGPGTLREISSLSGMKKFIEKTICCQVAQSLYRDFASFGLKQSSVDLDRSSVRLFVSGEWDGNCIGDGRVPDTKPTSCMFFEPYLTPEMTLTIKCVLQAVDTSKLSGLGVSRKNGKGEPLFDIEWERIPGHSDVAKLVWLLEKTTGLPEYFNPFDLASLAVAKTA